MLEKSKNTETLKLQKNVYTFFSKSHLTEKYCTTLGLQTFISSKMSEQMQQQLHESLQKNHNFVESEYIHIRFR